MGIGQNLSLTTSQAKLFAKHLENLSYDMGLHVGQTVQTFLWKKM
jgi:hypothetical protein